MQEYMLKLSKINIKDVLLDTNLRELKSVIENDMQSSSQLSTCQEELYPVKGEACILGKDLFKDVEMFETYSGDDNTVLKTIDKTYTQGGSRYLYHIIKVPLHDVSTLKERMLAIKFVQSKLKELTKELQVLKDNEDNVSWVFSSDKDDLSQLFDIVYFSNLMTRKLNKLPKALTCYNFYRMIISPSIGILSPLAYVVIPFLVLRLKLGVKVSFFSFVRYLFKMVMASDMTGILMPSFSSLRYVSYLFTLIFYFQGIFNSIELSKAVYRISKLITNKVNSFITFIQSIRNIKEICISCDITKPFVTSLDIDSNVELFNNVDCCKFSVFNNFGLQMSVLKHLNKKLYLPLINYAYCVDAISSMAQLSNEPRYSHAHLINAIADAPITSIIRPFLSLADLTHPCLDYATSIPNTVTLGGMTNDKTNIIITGPNAGGKSTLIKSVLVATILAQTITITPSTKMSLIPFYLIKSQINIPDCKGKESLFEAEMLRSKENLDILKTLTQYQTALVVMDEIFNSTNPVEGIAGAYAIAQHMSNYSNCATMITTHYLYLVKLSKEHPFTNYKMNVDVQSDGSIRYPYKLRKGVSRQFVALELLRNNGFDKNLVEDAIKIKDKLVSKKSYALESKNSDCNDQVERS